MSPAGRTARVTAAPEPPLCAVGKYLMAVRWLAQIGYFWAAAVSVIITGTVRIHSEHPYGTRKPLY